MEGRAAPPEPPFSCFKGHWRWPWCHAIARPHERKAPLCRRSSSLRARARACAPTRTRSFIRSPGGRSLLHLLDTRGCAWRRQEGRGGRQGPRAGRSGIPGRGVAIAIQAEQKGTGHAVQQAAEALAGYDGPVIILYGDTPFVEATTLQSDAGPARRGGRTRRRRPCLLARGSAEVRPDHSRGRRPDRQDGRI